LDFEFRKLRVGFDFSTVTVLNKRFGDFVSESGASRDVVAVLVYGWESGKHDSDRWPVLVWENRDMLSDKRTDSSDILQKFRKEVETEESQLFTKGIDQHVSRRHSSGK
jgi:hypothetical protein